MATIIAPVAVFDFNFAVNSTENKVEPCPTVSSIVYSTVNVISNSSFKEKTITAMMSHLHYDSSFD